MNNFGIYINKNKWVISLISAIFIIYPNIATLPWMIRSVASKVGNPLFFTFFTYRFIYFTALFVCLIFINIKKISSENFKKRFLYNFLFSTAAYGLFLPWYFWAASYGFHDFWGSVMFFQFFVICLICTLIGHISILYKKQQEKELEIENLQIENLQSRCNALMNQINPHFFFNSLNGISSLVRKNNNEKTLRYVDELSDIFRYILQSDRKGLVTLGEELEFAEAFRYVMEVRFADKLTFSINVEESQKQKLTLPTLSLLPLMDNVMVHNRVDGDNPMVISIFLNEQSELVVSNKLSAKTTVPQTNGTGLQNLGSRFQLLKNIKIRVEKGPEYFTVYLPL